MIYAFIFFLGMFTGAGLLMVLRVCLYNVNREIEKQEIITLKKVEEYGNGTDR